MFKLLKSDFYKIFRMKSFYVCAILSMVFAGLAVFAQDFLIYNQYGMYGLTPSFLGLTYFDGFKTALGAPGLFVMIVLSIFIASEFKFGTIKNMVSSGVGRVKIYFSKFIAGISISFVYAILSGITGALVAFFIEWNKVEFTRTFCLDALKVFGLYLLAEIAMQSIYMMVAFLTKSTGIAITTNVVIYYLFSSFFELINYGVKNWLHVENFKFSTYWPATYISTFLSEISQKDINTGIIVCSAYLVAATALGIFSFCKRDVK